VVVVAGAQKHPHQKPASCRRAPSRLHPGVVRSLLALQLLYAAMFGSHLQFLLLDLARLVACRTTSAVDEGRARGSTRLVPFDGRIDPASSPPSRLMRVRHVLRCSLLRPCLVEV